MFSKKNENASKNPLLFTNLTSLAIFGLWPFQSEEFLNKKYLRYIHFAIGLIVYCLFFAFLITEYIELYYVWGNLEDMTTNMSVSCLYTVGVVKIYSFYGHRNKLKYLIGKVSNIETNILKYQSIRLKTILYEYIKSARRITYFFWTLTFCTILVFFVIPPIEYRFSSTYRIVFENGTEFWSYQRPMIFSSWFPFDKYAFPNYLIAYMYQVFMGSVGASYQAIWDMFIVAMMIHSIGQLRILRSIMEDLTKDDMPVDKVSDWSMNQNKDLKRMWDNIKHKRLVDCVNHHRYIIRFVFFLFDTIFIIRLLIRYDFSF